MEELEQMVQIVTDRLMKKLHASNQPTVAFIGEENKSITHYYREKGYQDVTDYAFLSPDVLVVTELSLFSLTRIAQLVPQNNEEETILQHLLQKKNLHIVEEGMELSKKRSILPGKMTAEFDKAKATLLKWGATFEKETKAPIQTQTPSKKPVKRELITIAKVQALSLKKGDVFQVTPNMIVTALAKDYLKDHDITIEKRVL